MNKHKSLKSTQSLLERASDLYGFNDVMRGKATKPDGKADRLQEDAKEPLKQPISKAVKPTEPVQRAQPVQPTEPVQRAQPVQPKAQPVQPKAQKAPAAAVKQTIAQTASHKPIERSIDGISVAEEKQKLSPNSPSLKVGQEVKPTSKIPTSEVNDTAAKKASVARRGPGQMEVRKIDRKWLSSNNLIVPDGPVTSLSEELRIVKRQLLLAARGAKGMEAVEHGERILVCSANPNEGKTYTSVNLALSLASEKDNRVLLIDADFPKPSVLSTLNIQGGPGLMDALADPSRDVNEMVMPTDVEGLSILPAGSQSNQDTEYLAAARTAKIIDKLSRDDPNRIIIFDSPPALAASPASVLAMHVGQTLLVVRADKTTDSALRDALNLLSGCDHVQLLLNRATFSPSGRNFGSYYGYGAV